MPTVKKIIFTLAKGEIVGVAFDEIPVVATANIDLHDNQPRMIEIRSKLPDIGPYNDLVMCDTFIYQGKPKNAALKSKEGIVTITNGHKSSTCMRKIGKQAKLRVNSGERLGCVSTLLEFDQDDSDIIILNNGI